MPQWTKAQGEAIGARGCNLLVAAAAGSGKTAVLVERVLALLREGEPLSEMLMVTFTRAAATEMRGRILSALQDAAENGDLRLGEQAAWVERADIRTLHGFCQSVLRRYFQAADVDPSFRVADDAQARILSEQAMEQALIESYEAEEHDFHALTACLTPEEAGEWALAVYGFMVARPDPWTWLEQSIQNLAVVPEVVENCAAMSVLLRQAETGVQAALAQARRMIRFCQETPLLEKYIDTALQDEALCQRVLDTVRGGSAALSLLTPPTFPRRPVERREQAKPFVERLDALRNTMKESLQKACGLDLLRLSPEEHATDARLLGAQLRGLASLLHRYEQAYIARKEALGLLDYSDLEQRALKALRQDEVAGALQGRYRHIFVDEYQDSSPLQEALIERVTRGDNLFLVGDVKQSIYRFRQADPTLFLRRYHDYPVEPGGRDWRIDLNENFRSYPPILNAVNRVFARVMRASVTEIEYDRRAALHPGLDPKDDFPPVEIHLIDEGAEAEPGDENESAQDVWALKSIEREALWIAQRILALRGTPGMRGQALRFRDMVILLRAPKGRAARVMELLRGQGVPAWSDIGDGFFDELEVAQTLDLLRVIDNPRQDEALLGSLRGPALGLDERALADIRVNTPRGTYYEAVVAASSRPDALGAALRDFLMRVEGWRFQARHQPLHALIHTLYEQTDFLAQAGALPGGRARQANLRMLAEEAARYQANQLDGLSAFVRHVGKLRTSGDTQSATDIGEADDVVRILSMHKSKGLQFPVVFLAGLGQRFRKLESSRPVVCHDRLGIGAYAYDPELGTRRQTLNREAILTRLGADNLAEEARVLYVAMTRAEKYLLLYGCQAKLAESMAQWDRDAENADDSGIDASVSGARCFFDWIMPSVMRHTDAAGLRASYGLTEEELQRAKSSWLLETHPTPAVGTGAGTQINGGLAEALLSQSATEATTARMYADLSAKPLPYKRSITELVQTGRAEQAPLGRRPLFLQEQNARLTGTERGEAIHRLLSRLDLKMLRECMDLTTAIDAARREALARGVLSPAQAQALTKSGLETFFSGPLGKRMLASPHIEREWPFNMRMATEEGTVLVQGVVDCCFWEKDGWILVDYKTDRADDLEDVLDHYRPQLAHYATALETITGHPVKERLLYLFALGQAFPV